jgi:hypothetical protein
MRQHNLNPESDPAPQKVNVPVCPLCRGYGYTGCAEAQLPDGDVMAVAFERGTACSCAAGSEFARAQMEWLKPDAATVNLSPDAKTGEWKSAIANLAGRKSFR